MGPCPVEIQSRSFGAASGNCGIHSANKKVALSRIRQVYVGMDLELLAGEPTEPDELSDGFFATMLDRLWGAGCENF